MDKRLEDLLVHLKEFGHSIKVREDYSVSDYSNNDLQKVKNVIITFSFKEKDEED